MKEQLVIVEKLAIDMHIKSAKSSKQILKDSERFVHEYVLPMLEKILLAYKFKETVRLDYSELEINLDRFKIDKTNSQFYQSELESILKKKLDQLILPQTKPNGNRKAREKTFGEILVYFLSNGLMPWFTPKGYVLEKEFRKFISKPNGNKDLVLLLANIKKLISKDSIAFKRLIYQFDDELLMDLLTFDGGFPGESSDQKAVMNMLRAANPKIRSLIFSLLFYKIWFEKVKKTTIILPFFEHFISLDQKERQKLFHTLKFLARDSPVQNSFGYQNTLEISDLELFHIIMHHPTGKIVPKEVNDRLTERKIQKKLDAENRKDEKRETPEVLFVNNGGLVLIHTFLLDFFRKINAIDQTNKIQKGNYDLAVHALSYISSGKTGGMESDFLLEKYLCGIPINYPVDRHFQLDETIINESDAMLDAAISHWKKLKSTSANGLREMFFWREGKLETKNSRLTVNRLAQDILLDSIPWNISIIKFPWMKSVLFVNW
ncbi:contractile injection system tape measure protein [Belliella marina]|uniref:Contractile injection system tape measure protein n=1 Tax=Belliella marina TaxID=1644146 RepID=A0ABW4VS88_9BACT